MSRRLCPFSRLFCVLGLLLMATFSLPAASEVDGAWNFVFITEIGDRPFPVTLSSEGETVKGPFMNQEFQGTFKEGKLALTLKDFYSPDAGFKGDLSIEGVVKDGKIEGTWRFGEYSGPMKGGKAEAAAAAVAAPAVAGTWNFVLITEIGDKPAVMTLAVDGETVSGKAGEFNVTGSYKDSVLTLKVPDFYSPDAGFKADLGLQGKVTGTVMEGRWNFAEYSGSVKGNKVE